jgi:hypothetical protein
VQPAGSISQLRISRVLIRIWQCGRKSPGPLKGHERAGVFFGIPIVERPMVPFKASRGLRLRNPFDILRFADIITHSTYPDSETHERGDVGRIHSKSPISPLERSISTDVKEVGACL